MHLTDLAARRKGTFSEGVTSVAASDVGLPTGETQARRPRFSIVIPAYNEANFIGNCLDSLLRQDFGSTFEIIVVDNNSTDRTAELARSRGVTVVHEPRAGVCSARQRGTELARGEIVVSTDADTVFSPGWLRRIDAAFREEPSRVAVAGPCRFVDPPWWARMYTWALFHTVGAVARLTGHILYVTATNIAFRKSAWSGYDTDATQGADELGLLRRLRSRGPVAFDLGNPTFTSSRRLDRGLTYNVVVTCLYYYLAGYAVNRLAGRRVIGMAPAFRTRSAARAPIQLMIQRLASVSVGLVFCLIFGDLAVRLVEDMW
jgi:glycosyltransferase involved in cell wall biosynthesis